jgi:hypothetical protein
MYSALLDRHGIATRHTLILRKTGSTTGCFLIMARGKRPSWEATFDFQEFGIISVFAGRKGGYRGIKRVGLVVLQRSDSS